MSLLAPIREDCRCNKNSCCLCNMDSYPVKSFGCNHKICSLCLSKFKQTDSLSCPLCDKVDKMCLEENLNSCYGSRNKKFSYSQSMPDLSGFANCCFSKLQCPIDKKCKPLNIHPLSKHREACTGSCSEMEFCNTDSIQCMDDNMNCCCEDALEQSTSDEDECVNTCLSSSSHSQDSFYSNPSLCSSLPSISCYNQYNNYSKMNMSEDSCIPSPLPTNSKPCLLKRKGSLCPRDLSTHSFKCSLPTTMKPKTTTSCCNILPMKCPVLSSKYLNKSCCMSHSVDLGSMNQYTHSAPVLTSNTQTCVFPPPCSSSLPHSDSTQKLCSFMHSSISPNPGYSASCKEDGTKMNQLNLPINTENTINSINVHLTEQPSLLSTIPSNTTESTIYDEKPPLPFNEIPRPLLSSQYSSAHLLTSNSLQLRNQTNKNYFIDDDDNNNEINISDNDEDINHNYLSCDSSSFLDSSDKCCIIPPSPTLQSSPCLSLNTNTCLYNKNRVELAPSCNLDNQNDDDSDSSEDLAFTNSLKSNQLEDYLENEHSKPVKTRSCHGLTRSCHWSSEHIDYLRRSCCLEENDLNSLKQSIQEADEMKNKECTDPLFNNSNNNNNNNNNFYIFHDSTIKDTSNQLSPDNNSSSSSTSSSNGSLNCNFVSDESVPCSLTYSGTSFPLVSSSLESIDTHYNYDNNDDIIIDESCCELPHSILSPSTCTIDINKSPCENTNNINNNCIQRNKSNYSYNFTSNSSSSKSMQSLISVPSSHSSVTYDKM